MVELILEMHSHGHPSYACIDEEAVRRRAADLPEKGIPSEVWKVVQEATSTHDKLQPQKAATPCDAMEGLEAAGKTFSVQRARAIVAEGESREEANARELAALKEMQDNLLTEAQKELNAALLNLEVRTGNKFVDQFRPEYFATAFPFCFKHATACPDVVNTAKLQEEGEGAIARPPRRQAGNPNAPQVGIKEWAAAMARRVETQFRRDWTFCFTLWNYLFRTLVNLQKNAYMYAIPDPRAKGGKRMLTNEEIADGSLEIMQHLQNGLYTDVTGSLKPVQGDLTKLRHVPGLGLPAQKVLSNTEARTRRIPGTHEIRKTMRHQTNAYRVCYGTAIFITVSPKDNDTSLMVRFVRARRSDPAIVKDGSGKFQQRQAPALDIDYMNLSPEALAEARGAAVFVLDGNPQRHKRAYSASVLRHAGNGVLVCCCRCPARSCCHTMKGKLCLPATPWLVQKGSKRWSCSPCATSLECASVPNAPIAPSRTSLAQMPLEAMPQPWEVYLGGWMPYTARWNARRAETSTSTCKPSSNAFTSCARYPNCRA